MIFKLLKPKEILLILKCKYSINTNTNTSIVYYYYYYYRSKLQNSLRTLNDKSEALKGAIRSRAEIIELLKSDISEKMKLLSEKITDLPIFKHEDSDDSQNSNENSSDDDFEKCKVKGSKRIRSKKISKITK